MCSEGGKKMHSLGLTPELWDMVYQESRRLMWAETRIDRWRRRVREIGAMISESRSKWTLVRYDAEFTEIIHELAIKFASNFKLLEITYLQSEDPVVSIYVWDSHDRSYQYLESEEVDHMFDEIDSEEWEDA
jgi:hypothetical protein